MPFFKFNNIRIAAIEAAVPSKVVHIESFYKQFGEEYVKKFSETTGIKKVRHTREHQTASDLAYAAAAKILDSRQIEPTSIKALVFVAHSSDYRRPATACVLHKRLGLSKDCAAFDISLGCSAFVYGLQTICSLMCNSDIDRALLLVGETMSKLANPQDKSVAMLFGDGGAAILLEKTQENKIIQGLVKTDGTGFKAIIAPGGGARYPEAPHSDFECKDGSLRNLYNSIMQGEDVFSFTISDVPRTVKEFFQKTDTVVEDYDCLAFHQANLFIHKMLAKKLKCDISMMPICIDNYGNTSAAAIPLLLCEIFGNSDVKEAVKCLVCGFGVGLSWGVSSFDITPIDIMPVIENDDIYDEGIIKHPDELAN